MPALAAAFAVELVDEHELVCHLPDDVATDPQFYHRLAAFLAQDARPTARLGRRDALIRELAATCYTGSKRAVAQALLADANNYRASSWRFHRRSTTCPPEIEGTRQGQLWRAFKAAPRFSTSWRQIWNIIR